MTVLEAINQRRSLRSLKSSPLTDDQQIALAQAAALAPSCFNNQPWKFIFVREKENLKTLHEALSPGNDWAKAAPLMIAVISRKEDDCVIKERLYYQFDTGMATAFMMLRAQELGFFTHAMAGFVPNQVREALFIPEDYEVITLIAVGSKDQPSNPLLSPEQQKQERERPARKQLKEFVFWEKFMG